MSPVAACAAEILKMNGVDGCGSEVVKPRAMHVARDASLDQGSRCKLYNLQFKREMVLYIGAALFTVKRDRRDPGGKEVPR